MSDAEIDSGEETKRRAYDAIRGANNWLVAVRNATDEGWEPWSDKFTSEDEERGWAKDYKKKHDEEPPITGILSYSEGLTAIWLTNEYASDEDLLTWYSLQEDLYKRDVMKLTEWILDSDEDSGEKYDPLPYLPPKTENFVDAASFSTTALLGALDSDIEFNEDGEKKIKEAVRTNVNWLLRNTVDTEEGVGWSYIGSEGGRDDKPYKYFTYSGAIALTDIINDDYPDAGIKEETKEDIKGVLESAKNYLVKQDFVDVNSLWENPGPGRRGDKVVATCYTLIGVSYMARNISIDIEDDDWEKINEAFETMWKHQPGLASESALRDDQIRGYTANYQMFEKENSEYSDLIYTDGSGPYLLIEVMLEYMKLIDHLDRSYPGYISEQELELQTDNAVDRVLDTLWMGDDEYEIKGFKHVRETGEEPTVIYTTQTAIDTLLKYIEGADFGIEDMKELRLGKPQSRTSTDQEDEAPARPEDTKVERKDSPKVVYIDETSDGYAEEIKEQVREIKQEVKASVGGTVPQQEGTDELINEIWAEFGEAKAKNKEMEWNPQKKYTGSIPTLGDHAEEIHRSMNKVGISSRISDEYEISDVDNVEEAIWTADNVEVDAEGIKDHHSNTFVNEIMKNVFQWDEDESTDEFNVSDVQYYIQTQRNMRFYPMWDEKLKMLEELDNDLLNDPKGRKVAVDKILDRIGKEAERRGKPDDSVDLFGEVYSDG